MADKFFNAFKLGQLAKPTRRDAGRIEESAKRAGEQSVRPGDDAAAAQAQAETAAFSSIQNQLYYVDGSDAMANQGFTISFMHVPSGNSVFFKAFINSFNETFSCDWSEEAVYGRADPIRMFKQNTRNITLALMVPAASEGEAFENLAKIQKLVSFLYPSYSSTNNALAISQSPLIRMRVFNLATNAGAGTGAGNDGSINNPATGDNKGYTFEDLKDGLGIAADDNITETGLLGIIKNLSVNHNLENTDFGAFQYKGGNVLPKAIEINLDFGVIHEHHLGWNGEDNFSNNVFPYGANLEQSGPKTPAQLAKEMQEGAKGWMQGTLDQQSEEDDERLPEQAKQISQAKYLRAKEKLISLKPVARVRDLRATRAAARESELESEDGTNQTEPSAPQVNVDFSTLLGQ